MVTFYETQFSSFYLFREVTQPKFLQKLGSKKEEEEEDGNKKNFGTKLFDPAFAPFLPIQIQTIYFVTTSPEKNSPKLNGKLEDLRNSCLGCFAVTTCHYAIFFNCPQTPFLPFKQKRYSLDVRKY